RQRPLLARLLAALPLRHHQDRPVLRTDERQGRAPRGPALDHLARARSRHGGSGRRRRNRFGCGRALSARLRICAGLLLRRADERGRRQGAAARRGHKRSDLWAAPQTDRPVVIATPLTPRKWRSMLATPSISALTRVHSPPQSVTPLFAGYARASTPLATRSARKSRGEDKWRPGGQATHALAWRRVACLCPEHAAIE